MRVRVGPNGNWGANETGREEGGSREGEREGGRRRRSEKFEVGRLRRGPCGLPATTKAGELPRSISIRWSTTRQVSVLDQYCSALGENYFQKMEWADVTRRAALTICAGPSVITKAENGEQRDRTPFGLLEDRFFGVNSTILLDDEKEEGGRRSLTTC